MSQRVQCDKRQKFKQNERVPMTPSFGLVWFGLVEFRWVCSGGFVVVWLRAATGGGLRVEGSACDDVDSGKWLS